MPIRSQKSLRIRFHVPLYVAEDVVCWGSDPRLPRIGYDRLRASLVSGGFVSPGTPYEAPAPL
jgi:hypothetical protein